MKKQLDFLLFQSAPARWLMRCPPAVLVVLGLLGAWLLYAVLPTLAPRDLLWPTVFDSASKLAVIGWLVWLVMLWNRRRP